MSQIILKQYNFIKIKMNLKSYKLKYHPTVNKISLNILNSVINLLIQNLITAIMFWWFLKEETIDP